LDLRAGERGIESPFAGNIAYLMSSKKKSFVGGENEQNQGGNLLFAEGLTRSAEKGSCPLNPLLQEKPSWLMLMTKKS